MSIPVGYETVIKMHSLDFEEFLWANGISQTIIDSLHKYVVEVIPVPELIHQRMRELVRNYIIVGGMPAVVNEFILSHMLNRVLDLQRNIVKGYRDDMVKYAPSNEKNKMYTIHDEQTQVVSCIRQMALNQEKCEVLTDSIADKLLMSEKLAQAKIYRMGSNVKKGSLIQALVQNSSDELLFVVAKVEHSKWYDGSDLSKKYGFSGDKKSLWKSAVFSMFHFSNHK